MSRNPPAWVRDVAMRLGTEVEPVVMWRCRRASCDGALLRDLVLEHVGRRPVSARELFERVRADFGTCSERSLWRALAWQVERGAIVAVGTRAGYVRGAVTA